MKIKVSFIFFCLIFFTSCSNQTSDTLFKTGVEKLNQNDFDLAIDLFNKSIEKDSTNPNPYNSRGTAKALKGDSSGALHDYSKAIELASKKGTHIQFSEAYYNRGVLYFKTGRLDSAKKDLSISIIQDRQCAECYYNRGLVNLKSQLIQDAFEDFSAACDLNNGYYEAFFFRGNVKQMLNDHKGSIEDYNKAIEINSTREIMYYNRAVSHLALHEYSQAISDCDILINKLPDYAPAYSLKGDVMQESGQLRAACELWQKAYELGDEYGYTMKLLFCK